MAAAVLLLWLAGFKFGLKTAVVALTTVGFGAAVAGVLQPSLGLLGIGILATTDALNEALVFTGGLYRFNTLNYWLLLICSLHAPILIRLRDVHSRLLHFLILVLAFQLVFTPSLNQGLQQLLYLISAFGILIYFIRASKDTRVWFWLAVVSALLSAMGGLVHAVEYGARTVTNANAVSLLPLTGMYAVAMGLSGGPVRPREGNLLLILGAVNGMWVLLSGSRGSMLVGCLLVALMFCRIESISRRVLLVAVGLLACIGLSILFSDATQRALRRVELLVDAQESINARTSGRWEVALKGWYIFLEKPWGVGTGGFQVSSDIYREGIYYTRGTQRAAHSGWVKVLAENGLVGIFCLGAYVVSFAYVGWRRREKRLLQLGMVTTMAIGVALLAQEFQSKGLWLFAMGASVLLNPSSLRSWVLAPRYWDSSSGVRVNNLDAPAQPSHVSPK